MATQAIDLRNNRVVVLVSEGEKRRIAANASAADMSMSDFMRTAAQRHSEPTDAEQRLMAELLGMLEDANARTDASLAKLTETHARAIAFDEDAYRAAIKAELDSRDDLDWSAMVADLGLGRA